MKATPRGSLRQRLFSVFPPDIKKEIKMEIVNLQNELIHGLSHLQPFLQSARARSGNPQQQRAAWLLLTRVISQRLQVDSVKLTKQKLWSQSSTAH